MRRHIVRGSLVLAFALCVAARGVKAQGPTIDSGGGAPGSSQSLLGPIPGSGGALLGDQPGGTPDQGAYLGGRPGVSTPRVPTAVSSPGMQISPTNEQQGIAAPPPLPIATAPLYGSLALPSGAEDEGPKNGLTLDQAIETLVRDNLDLRAKYFEIPQAEADILTASLRANPVFYADGQLAPYGRYSRAAPGGQTQYDVNVSWPFDISHKRQARTRFAAQAKRVLEAQYQDAVRGAIDNLYTAYVDVLAARQTVRYSRASVKGLEQVYHVTDLLYQKDQATRADVNRVKIQRDTASIGLLDAEESLRQRLRVLGALLFLPPDDAANMTVRGTIEDVAPPPPSLEELRQIAMQVRPDIVAYRIGIRSAEANVKLALANRFTDVYVLYQPYTFQDNSPYGLKSPTSWALGVTVPIPLYNRNQGGILRAKLNVTQTQIQLSTIERQVLAVVDQAAKEYEVTRKAVERIRSDLLPAAKQVRDDTYRLYIGGEVNVVSYLNAQRDFNDIVKQYLDTVVRHRRSMLALNTALGQRILP